MKFTPIVFHFPNCKCFRRWLAGQIGSRKSIGGGGEIFGSGFTIVVKRRYASSELIQLGLANSNRSNLERASYHRFLIEAVLRRNYCQWSRTSTRQLVILEALRQTSRFHPSNSRTTFVKHNRLQGRFRVTHSIIPALNLKF